MRAVWSGTLGFGLVNIPVKLYSAVSSKTISFKLLHSECKTPIKLVRKCEKCKKELGWNEILHGLDLGEGFITFSHEELKKLAPRGEKIIEIKEFIDPTTINPLLHDKNYYLIPEKNTKAFFLLSEILSLTNMAAVAKFIMRQKEYTALIRSYQKALLLTTLHYENEVRPLDQFEILKTEVKFSEDEKKLAKNFVEMLTSKKFDPKKYRDTYLDQLRAVIENRAPTPKQEEKEDDLMHLLKISIEKTKKPKKARR